MIYKAADRFTMRARKKSVKEALFLIDLNGLGMVDNPNEHRGAKKESKNSRPIS
jgi:hypothetical protein